MSTKVQAEVYTQSFTVYSAKKVNEQRIKWWMNQLAMSNRPIYISNMVVPWNDRYVL